MDATIMCHVSPRCRLLLLNVLITLPRWRICQSHRSTALILLDLGRRRGIKLWEALTLSNNKSKWVSDGSLYHRRTFCPFAVCRKYILEFIRAPLFVQVLYRSGSCASSLKVQFHYLWASFAYQYAHLSQLRFLLDNATSKL